MKKLLVIIIGLTLSLLAAVLVFRAETEPTEFENTVKVANTPDVRAREQYPTRFKTFKNTLAAAKKGDPDAQFFLGWVYGREQSEKVFKSSAFKRRLNDFFEKFHVPLGRSDENRSVYWLRLAAEQGQINAQAVLCSKDNLEKGYLTENESQKWLLNAAEKGDWLAQNNISYRVAKTNLVERYKWRYLANQKNPDPDRAASLTNLAVRMSPAEMEDAQRSINEFTKEKSSSNPNGIHTPISGEEFD